MALSAVNRQHVPPVHLIICGAEKCGTTSLFAYLSAHPDVCASSRKETDHFRDPDATLASYMTYFGNEDERGRVLLESSPGYMAESAAVAPRLASALPQARLVFLLRDPVDRLRSSFRFYKSRLHLPDDMSFETFVAHCLALEEGRLAPDHIGLAEWHLRSLSRGRYEQQVADFSREFPATQMKLVHYDRLRDDVHGCVSEVADFAGLDAGFFDGFSFGRENVSFLARNRSVQRLAIAVNDGFEGLWRRHPALKKRLLRLYKRLNERELTADPLSEGTLSTLRRWYAPTLALLNSLPRSAGD